MISSLRSWGAITVFSLLLILTFVPMHTSAQSLDADAVKAAGGTGGGALNFAPPDISDTADCVPAFVDPCGCMKKTNPKTKQCDPFMNKYQCPCHDPRGVTGMCTGGQICKGTGYKDEKGGSGTPGLDQLMKALGDLLGKLMQGSKDDKGGQPPPTTQPPTGSQGCTGAPFQTSDVSLLQGNPCAQYVPSTTLSGLSGADTSNSLLGSLLTGAQSPDLSGVVNSAANTNTPANVAANTNTSADLNAALNQNQNPFNTNPLMGGLNLNGTPTSVGLGTILSGNGSLDNVPPVVTTVAPAPIPTPNTPAPPETAPAPVYDTTKVPRLVFATTTSMFTGLVPAGGSRGDILATQGGVTVIAGTRDIQGNTEVAGFYGSDTFNTGQPQGLIGQWCQTRPWATNFLAQIITPSFFDGLCSWRGYTVGPPAPPQKPTLQQTPLPKKPVAPPKPPPSATTTLPTIPKKVDIWAVPASVPLGARTSIFWSTKGVTNCTETSPDGSFNQSSLSGGAATVALTGATTFTISCLAPDGSHATDFVTVELKN